MSVDEGRIANSGYAATKKWSKKDPLVPFEYTIRKPLAEEVLIEIYYAGICHSDLHTVNGDWTATFPIVPGHEIAGKVVQVGKNVSMHKLGDNVGIGCMVGSCRECKPCKNDTEQFCPKVAFTFNGVQHGEPTYGGYGKYIVCPEHFVVAIPSNVEMKSCPPLFCAGITTYSPLMRNGADKGGMKIGVHGIGGLGHMCIKYAVAMGNEVWGITRTPGKVEEAKKLGAHGCLLSTDEAEFEKHAGSFDLIVDTVCVNKNLDQMLSLLSPYGVWNNVGAPEITAKFQFSPFNLFRMNRAIQGNVIGGMKETREMLEFSAKYGIKPECTFIKADQIHAAYESLTEGGHAGRYVIVHKEI